MATKEIIGQRPLSVEGEEIAHVEPKGSLRMRYVLLTGVGLGLLLNWLSTYLRISMGFLGVGIGSFSVLLIGKVLFGRYNADSKENLTLTAVAFGATRAAEASVGLLFLIWLFTNESLYNVGFLAPTWLLPSSQTLKSRSLLTVEWVVPLLTHYFLMFVPGLVGLAVGWILKDLFLSNEKEYPFPGVVQTSTVIEVLTENNKTKIKIFKRFGMAGFVFALITFPLMALDLSNPSAGFTFGLYLGPIGVALFGIGFIINNPKISISVAFSSLLAFTFGAYFLVGPQASTSFFDFYNYALQNVYFSFAIGFLLSGMIVGPIFWGVVRSVANSFRKKATLQKNQPEGLTTTEETSERDVEKNSFSGLRSLVIQVLNHRMALSLIMLVYIFTVAFVSGTGILGGTHLILIAVLMFWVIVVGGFVSGYLMVNSSSKTSASIAPPFIFDWIPVYLLGGRGYLPFVALPASESDGTMGIVSSQKLSDLNKVDKKKALLAYLCGYLAATLTTPFFALLLWHSFGVGTAQLPAPAFPVQGALVASFASGAVDTFLSVVELGAGLLAGLVLTFFGTSIAIGLSLGFFFPPHMAMCLLLGALTRIGYNKQLEKKDQKNEGNTIGSGLALGGSLVIPIMILFALLF